MSYDTYPHFTHLFPIPRPQLEALIYEVRVTRGETPHAYSINCVRQLHGILEQGCIGYDYRTKRN